MTIAFDRIFSSSSSSFSLGKSAASKKTSRFNSYFPWIDIHSNRQIYNTAWTVIYHLQLTCSRLNRKSHHELFQFWLLAFDFNRIYISWNRSISFSFYAVWRKIFIGIHWAHQAGANRYKLYLYVFAFQILFDLWYNNIHFSFNLLINLKLLLLNELNWVCIKNILLEME